MAHVCSPGEKNNFVKQFANASALDHLEKFCPSHQNHQKHWQSLTFGRSRLSYISVLPQTCDSFFDGCNQFNQHQVGISWQCALRLFSRLRTCIDSRLLCGQSRWVLFLMPRVKVYFAPKVWLQRKSMPYHAIVSCLSHQKRVLGC